MKVRFLLASSILALSVACVNAQPGPQDYAIVQQPTVKDQCAGWVDSGQRVLKSVACGGGGGSPGGSNTQLQYNNSSAFGGVTGATTNGTFLTLTSAIFITPTLGTPVSGNLANTTGYTVGNLAGLGAGVSTFLGTPTSANLLAAVTDETGTGALVFANGPTLIAPILGTPASGNASNLTNIPVAQATGILPAANGGAGATSGILQANGAGLVGAATIGNGLNYTSPTLSLTNTINAQTGTTYAVASSDAAKIITASNAASQAYSIVQANTAGFTSGYGTSISNIGAGTVTLTATTSTFGNGLTTLGIAPGQVADIGSNGTNYPFTAMSLPVMAQDTLLGNPNASNYPIAMSLPSCAADGTHALTYAAHALGCTVMSGGATNITVGTTTIASGTTTRLPYNNAGVYGEIVGSSWNGTLLTLPGLVVGGSIDLSGAASRNINMNGSSEIDVGGSTRLSFSGGSMFWNAFFAGPVAGTAGFSAVTGSTTVPSILPNWSGSNTSGLWTSAAGDTSFIRTGVEKIRLTGEGIQYKQATPPAVGGTATPSIATGSTDEAGEVTAGTSATSVTITFNLTHASAPFCVVTAQPQISSFAYTLSNTVITITQTATTADKIDYRCTFP